MLVIIGYSLVEIRDDPRVENLLLLYLRLQLLIAFRLLQYLLPELRQLLGELEVALELDAVVLHHILHRRLLAHSQPIPLKVSVLQAEAHVGADLEDYLDDRYLIISCSCIHPLPHVDHHLLLRLLLIFLRKPAPRQVLNGLILCCLCLGLYDIPRPLIHCLLFLMVAPSHLPLIILLLPFPLFDLPYYLLPFLLRSFHRPGFLKIGDIFVAINEGTVDCPGVDEGAAEF